MMLTAVVVAVMAAQGDGPSVQALMELASNQAATRAPRSGDPVPSGLLLAAMAQAENLFEREGVPLDGAAQEWLRARLIRQLEAELSTIPPQPGLARREAWERLVRLVTTPQFAEQGINAWLSLPPLTLPEVLPTTGTWSQATQLEGAERFVFEHLAVAEEIGSEGLVNQLIDPGEWVRLEVTFSNATKQPWFSTSAFPRVSGCAWVDVKRTVVVGEMAPGGRASVSLWAYFPSDCTTPSTLRLGLADTHRGSPVGALAVELTPMPFVRPHAAALRLDTDALGSSDGSQAKFIAPSQHFELVADVRVPGPLVSRVESRWSIAAPARGLFKMLTFRGTPAVAQGNGLFAAGDDLDGETVDEDAWRALASRDLSLERWMVTPASGRLWLAMDTTVTLTAPPAPVVAPRAVKPLKVAPVLFTTPPASTVAELVKQFVEIEPHAVARERPTAVEAVSGYELLFDRAGFIKAYEALLAPPTVEPVAPAEPTVRYVTRTYLAVAAQPFDARQQVVEEPAPPPPIVRESPAPVETKTTWLQLDLGGGLSIFGVHATGSVSGLWGGNDVGSFPSLNVKAFIGPHVVGVLAFQYATYVYAPGQAARYFEVSGNAGAGYSFRWQRVSLTPWAGLLLSRRSHTLVGDQGNVGGELGLNVRVALVASFGLSLDLSMPLSLGGPYGSTRFNTRVATVEGVGLRATLNLSFAF